MPSTHKNEQRKATDSHEENSHQPSASTLQGHGCRRAFCKKVLAQAPNTTHSAGGGLDEH